MKIVIAVLAMLALAVSAAAAVAASGALRPPYLAQVKPVYGVAALSQSNRVWTYNGDYLMAIFDYDRVNGNPNTRSLRYTVCHTMTTRRCVRRVWRGRPDIRLLRVLTDGTRRYIDFTWYVGPRKVRAARVWVYE